MILLGFMWLLLDKVASLNFLNVVLNGWKQNTYNGCTTCDVWDGKVIMSNPNSCACSIVSRVTWLACPFRISKCWLVIDIRLKTSLSKKAKNLLKQERKHPSSLLHCHVGSWLAKFDVIILQSFTFEITKPWYNTSCSIWVKTH